MKKIYQKLRAYYLIITAYLYDIRRYMKYSNSLNKLSNENKVKGLLTMTYHVIEKGLTMPETRLGFGAKPLNTLIDLCELYIHRNYNCSEMEFTHSIMILNEYVDFHRQHNYNLEQILLDKIQSLSIKVDIFQKSEQLIFRKSDFIKYKHADFKQFCESRYTVRNYSSKDIPIDILQDCVNLAQKSPSACNRQPNRIYIIKNKEIIKQALSLQNGNRGFGDLANALVVFTSDVSVFQSAFERNESYLNSGMFAMTFAYALHYYEIGSCALNWSVSKDRDGKMRRLLNVPEREVITLVMSCGYLPDEFNVAKSPRFDGLNVTKLIV